VERNPILAEAGAGIQLSPNATRVLRHWGVLDAVRAAAVSPERAEVRDGQSGRLLASVPAGAAAEARYGAPYLHIHRARLLDILIAAACGAGAEFRLGADVRAVTQDGAGVHAALADGGAFDGDLLIAADGSRSQIRAALFGGDGARFTRASAWRGLVAEERAPDTPPGAQVWTGPRRHFVHYRVRDLDGRPQINFVAAIEKDVEARESWVLEGDAKHLAAAFADFAAPVRTIIAGAEQTFVTALYERSIPERWSQGRVALLGDSCHAMSPYMAQGAAIAIEDAAVLAGLLRERPGDHEAAFARYTDARRARALRVQTQSSRNGWFYHLSSPFLRAAARGVLSASDALRGPGKGRFDWLYAYDSIAAGEGRL
jgi:salicylate hydroxylase